MAQRRMFAKTIIDSDSFLDMPQSSQLLYFHLSMRADDEGFINNPKAIMRNVGCKEDDAKLLIAKKFIIPFESGVVVIKHWKIHNYIQKDRFTPTKYQEEKALLSLDENKAYTQCIQDGYNLDTQVRLGKDSIGKVSIGEDKKKETFVSLIEDYTDNPLLSSALHNYVEMRKKKKGYTTYALKLNLKTLSKLSNNDNEKIAIVEQSIESTWNSFYELKKPQGIVQTWERQAEEMSEAERLKLIEKMERWGKEPTKEEHIEKIKEEYNTLLEMREVGCDVERRIENVKLMYKDMTGEEL